MGGGARRTEEYRHRMAYSLCMLRDKKIETPWKKHDNIPFQIRARREGA